MISILGKNSNTWTNKIGIIRLYFGSIFPPVRLFQPVRLLILTKFPTSTFIHTSTFIWDFRVPNVIIPILLQAFVAMAVIPLITVKVDNLAFHLIYHGLILVFQA